MKKINTYTFIEREDRPNDIIAIYRHDSNKFQVWVNGSYTGYTFRTFKDAKEYAICGF